MREPLVHFLCAGALLFGGYALLHPERVARDASHRIELTRDDLRQIAVAWLTQGRPAPTPDEMRSLVESKLREEILYREALALGLDQGDTIVKRRLAQKMEFLFEDLSALREPTRAELEAWFGENSERFALPARATFRQLYFSPDRRGERTREAAEQALVKLAGKPADDPQAAALGDPFMLQDYYPDRSPEQVAREFGPDFARSLFEQELGAWRGPIQSGFGWHLVWVDSVMPSRVPAFEEVEPDVRETWVDEQRQVFKRQAFEQMKSRYVVVVPDDLAPPPGPSPVAAARMPDPAPQ